MRTLPGLIAVMFVSSIACAAAANPTIGVTGTVRGHDGTPMRAALVVLTSLDKPNQEQFADRLGRFTFRVDRPGAYTLIVAGVHHKTLFLPLFIDKPRTISLEIRLGAAKYRPRLRDLRVLGDFNKFSAESGSVAMEPQADGTFAAAVDWGGETLSYVVQGVLDEDETICGTQADSFVRDKRIPFFDDGDNQLVSVVKMNGPRVRIVFDPRQLPHSTAAPEVRFDDPTAPAAAIFAIDRALKIENRKVDRAMEAHVAGGGDPRTFKPDSSVQVRHLERLIQEDRNPLTWAYSVLRYFQYPEAKSNVALAKRVFTDIPATSPAWSLLWGGPENTFSQIASIANSPLEADYTTTAHEKHPDRTIRAAFLYIALTRASAKKDANTVARLHTRLLGDFGDTAYARRAISMAPTRNLQAGKPVPDFVLASLDDPTSTVTPTTLLGKTYLLDFWAIWCGPCVAEMPHLHSAYEKFRDKGLVIITVSFDEKLGDIADFRKTKWPMPWFNAQLPGFDHEIARAFEIVGIPQTVLVGPDGRILATGADLRGERLLQTFERTFAGRD